MRSWISAFLLGASIAFAPSCGAAALREFFSSTSGKQCRDLSKEHLSRWVCPGPHGLQATFFDEGNVVGISFGIPGAVPASTWRGAGRSFGDRVQWLLNPLGDAKAAILRTWEVGENDETVQALRIFIIEGHRSCERGQVRADLPGANERARWVAEVAVSRGVTCHR